MRKFVAALFIAGALALSGCMTPVGQVVLPSVAKSAVEDPAISTGCRDALNATPEGRALANATDVALAAANAGAFADPDQERGDDLAALASGALALNVDSCP